MNQTATDISPIVPSDPPTDPGRAPPRRSTAAIGTAATRSFAMRHLNELSLCAGLILLGAFLTVQTDAFFTSSNLLNLLRSAAFLAIVVWGMTLLIVGGEIDVSVGPAAAFSSVLFGWLAVKQGLPIPVAIVAVLAVTTAMGVVGGFLRSRFNVPSFVTTLALWSIYDGLKQVLSNNSPVTIRAAWFNKIGQTDLIRIPVPALIAAGLFLIVRYVSLNTVFGRSVFAVGGNAQAAYASGLNVAFVRVSLFGLTAMLAALTGLLQTSRLGTATPNIASGLEFSAIAAVVIGGTALSGGRGSLTGSLLGVLFISLVSNGLVLLGVNSQMQNVVRGLLILAAVLLNVVSKRGTKEVG